MIPKKALFRNFCRSMQFLVHITSCHCGDYLIIKYCISCYFLFRKFDLFPRYKGLFIANICIIQLCFHYPHCCYHFIDISNNVSSTDSNIQVKILSLSVPDDNNTRVLFERVLTSGQLKNEDTVGLWNRFLEFECNVGDLASIVKVEKRRAHVLQKVRETVHNFLLIVSFSSFCVTS